MKKYIVTRYLLLLAICQSLSFVDSYSQNSIDSTKTKHIFFIQPLNCLLKDYSIGYELKRYNKSSYIIIVDLFSPIVNDHEIGDTPSELEMYKGISIRSGFKYTKKSGTYEFYEGVYKLSGYENKLVLRDNAEGEGADIYYLESRVCHALGFAFNYGFEYYKHHIFFSPYFSVGARIRFDTINIYGKYNWRNELVSSENEKKYKVWPIPIFKVGILIGFGC